MEGFRRDIEGLRGVAVLAVVAFHADVPGLRGGYVGVDVFFVLSGYLITGLLLREHRQQSKVDVLGFYARRARRLLPAASVVLFVTAIATALVVAPSDQALYSRTALAASIYLSNVWFIRNTGDYFAAASEENPFLHTWSLAVEEQFYFLWPLLVYGYVRVRRSEHGLVLFLGLVSAISFAASAVSTPRLPVLAFFGMPTRAWEFGIGAIAAIVPRNSFASSERGVSAMAWAGAISLVASLVILDKGISFPGYLAVVPTFAAIALLIAGAAGSRSWPIVLLTSAPLQTAGRVSYSIYLWHWPALVLATHLVPHIGLPGKAVALGVSLILAIACYTVVERPIRQSARIAARPGVVVAAALAIAVASASGSELWHRWSEDRVASEAQRVFAVAKRDRAHVYELGCMPKFSGAEVVICERGDTTSRTEIVLFGDSHAAHWAPALELAGESAGWRVVTILKSACPATDVDTFNPSTGAVDDGCGRWRRAALAEIIGRRPALVVTSNSTGYVSRDGSKYGWAQFSAVEWKQALRRAIATLALADVPVVLLRDVPRPGFDVPNCLAAVAHRPWPTARACTVPRAVAVNDALFLAERQALAGLPRIGVIDMTEKFCDRTECRTSSENVISYFDGDHLSATQSRLLADALFLEIRKHLPANH